MQPQEKPIHESRGMSAMGRIFQLNVSDGGVPKQAVVAAEVNGLGLAGDRQIHTHVHGGPERALCLYSLERILDLQAEGHPIFPGAMGENLTLSGLDWEQVTPGARLKLGPQVVVEVTRYTVPCSALKPYFLQKEFSRVLQDKHPGWARVYVRVLQGGTLTTGDPVELESGEGAA